MNHSYNNEAIKFPFNLDRLFRLEILTRLLLVTERY